MNNNSLIKNIGATLEVLSEVDSTNNYAMQLVHDGTAEHGHAILGLCQTNGKGQRGKYWYTGKDSNLALSVVLNPSFLPANNAFYLQAFVCSSIASCLSTFTDNISIKWPNDIFYKNRKLGGVLIENTIQGQHLKYAVVGMGINLNDNAVSMFHANAVSLGTVIRKNIDLIEFAKLLLAALNTNWTLFMESPNAFYESYEKLLWKKDKVITIKQGEKPLTTILKTVNEQGQLICGEANEHCFNFGEIEWVY